jgi:hypothetical protein
LIHKLKKGNKMFKLILASIVVALSVFAPAVLITIFSGLVTGISVMAVTVATALTILV